MNIRTVTFDHLTNAEIAVWSAIQRYNPTFSSPFFRPEFTQAVAIMRKNVEVAVLEEDDLAIGFFPFEHMRRNHNLPVGTRLSDSIPLCEGVVDPMPLKAEVRSAWWAVRDGIRATPLQKLLKRPARMMYDLRGWMALR